MAHSNFACKILFSIIITFSFSTFARDWKKVEIPNTKCGDGRTYAVYVDIKDDQQLAVEFMGGGVCWSHSTCFGPNFRTWMFPLPTPPMGSTFANDKKKSNSPIKEYSMVYFPYCTGDVFAGKHKKDYSSGLGSIKSRVYHYGHSNILKSIEYLSKEKINFSKVKDFVIYGASAGAIGGLIHAKNFDKYIRKSAKRSLIADSPGLHFGKNFWDKFTDRMLSDFDEAFKATNLYIDFNNGLVAPQIPNVCHFLSDWNIGIIQSTKDIVMSRIFGEISQKDHKKLVLSSEGIATTILNVKNCSAFIPESRMHTYLLLKKSALKEIDNKNVYEFSKDIINGVQRTYIEL